VAAAGPRLHNPAQNIEHEPGVDLQQFENKTVLRREVRNKSIRGVELGGGEVMAQGQ
jgi:hypothetical protein